MTLSIKFIEVPKEAAFKVGRAARYLGISANTLRRKADLGLIPARKNDSGERIFLLRELDAYLNALPSYCSRATSYSSRLFKTGRR